MKAKGVRKIETADGNVIIVPVKECLICAKPEDEKSRIIHEKCLEYYINVVDKALIPRSKIEARIKELENERRGYYDIENDIMAHCISRVINEFKLVAKNDTEKVEK